LVRVLVRFSIATIRGYLASLDRGKYLYPDKQGTSPLRTRESRLETNVEDGEEVWCCTDLLALKGTATATILDRISWRPSAPSFSVNHVSHSVGSISAWRMYA